MNGVGVTCITAARNRAIGSGVTVKHQGSPLTHRDDRGRQHRDGRASDGPERVVRPFSRSRNL